MFRLYSISVNWGLGQIAFTEMDAALSSLHGDWIRFSFNQWFVWTNAGKAHVAETVRSASIGSHCVVAAIQPEAADGLASSWVWDWLNEKMQNQIQIQFSGDAS